MLSHKQIWSAIDALAARYGHSPSGLAKSAGLDPTTFNKSKRHGPQGRLRWPSTESIAKILQVTGASIEDFVALMSRGNGAKTNSRMIPFLPMKEAQKKKVFDEQGAPLGKAWDRIAFPDLGDASAFALEISNDAAAPTYRSGDIVVVSPAAELRKGDPVVVKNGDGCMLMRLNRQTAKKIELKALASGISDRVIDKSKVDWIARIVWVRQ